jgi:hypothetical protein
MVFPPQIEKHVVSSPCCHIECREFHLASQSTPMLHLVAPVAIILFVSIARHPEKPGAAQRSAMKSGEVGTGSA